MQKPPKIDPDFDGHLEKPLSQMTPREKLLWLSLQISLRHAIHNRVKRTGIVNVIYDNFIEKDNK